MNAVPPLTPLAPIKHLSMPMGESISSVTAPISEPDLLRYWPLKTQISMASFRCRMLNAIRLLVTTRSGTAGSRRAMEAQVEPGPKKTVSFSLMSPHAARAMSCFSCGRIESFSK